jgi:hypothetical protein
LSGSGLAGMETSFIGAERTGAGSVAPYSRVAGGLNRRAGDVI